jgi:hypothetical protein
MTEGFGALIDRVAQQRRAAHLQAAWSHERSLEFHRGVEQFFASLGDDAAVDWARHRAENEQRQAERERHHLRCLERSTSARGDTTCVR